MLKKISFKNEKKTQNSNKTKQKTTNYMRILTFNPFPLSLFFVVEKKLIFIQFLRPDFKQIEFSSSSLVNSPKRKSNQTNDKLKEEEEENLTFKIFFVVENIISLFFVC